MANITSSTSTITNKYILASEIHLSGSNGNVMKCGAKVFKIRQTKQMDPSSFNLGIKIKKVSIQILSLKSLNHLIIYQDVVADMGKVYTMLSVTRSNPRWSCIETRKCKQHGQTQDLFSQSFLQVLYKFLNFYTLINVFILDSP